MFAWYFGLLGRCTDSFQMDKQVVFEFHSLTSELIFLCARLFSVERHVLYKLKSILCQIAAKENSLYCANRLPATRSASSGFAALTNSRAHLGPPRAWSILLEYLGIGQV